MTLEEPSPASPSPILGEGETAKQAPSPEITTAQRKPHRLGRIALIVLLLGGCCVAIWYWGFRGPSDDIGRFQGDWKQTLGGRKYQEGDERVPAVAVRITGDRWQYLVGGKEAKAYKITLNETASPKEIEMTLLDANGKQVGQYRSHGIYAIDGKSVRVAVEPVNKARPKDFDNADTIVWVLTRE